MTYVKCTAIFDSLKIQKIDNKLQITLNKTNHLWRVKPTPQLKSPLNTTSHNRNCCDFLK
jgi:hypothetical protein